ncbi:Gmad2 immunoglobulin-like domain-containing protein [Cellulomonas hominis]
MRTRLHRPTASHRPRRLLGAVTAAVLLVALSACASTDDTVEPAASTQPPQTITHATTEPSTPPSASAEPTTGTDDGQDGAGDVPTNGTTTLTAPAPGATVAAPTVTFSGTATAFEGNLRWQVLPAAGGGPVAEGFTTGGANGEVGPFEVTQDLSAGTYRVEVWEPDESDGGGTATEDGRRNLVSVTFTVG